MVIKKNVVAAINKQINNEFVASYAYLAMASYFASINLDGFAAWMRAQSQEEIEHGMKLFNYLHDRDVDVELLEIGKPKQKWSSPLDVFEDVYAMEVKQSGAINDLVALADKEKEYTTQSILNWFLQEQIEEEATALRILEKLRLIGKDASGLLFLDKELGGRQQ
mgnify:CR=1 FL=1